MAGHKLRKILITGETRGEAEKLAFENFARAESLLARSGFAPINLLRLQQSSSGNWKWKDYILHALDLLLDCDALYLLKNWKQSKTARTHYLVAREFGINIIFEK